MGYTTCWATTTDLMENVSKCLWVTSRRQKEEKVDWEDQVQAFNTWWTAQFLQNSTAKWRPFGLFDPWPEEPDNPHQKPMHEWLMTDRNQKEMVLRDTLFSLQDIKMEFLCKN